MTPATRRPPALALLFTLIFSCSAVSFATGKPQDTAIWSPGPGWRLEWADDFSGGGLDEKSWNYETPSDGCGNNELEAYTAGRQNLEVKDGNLIITARYTGGDPAKMNYTSARITTQGKHSFLYGKIAARMKLTKGQGLWPAFWMLGENIKTAGWPACGEIDIMETGHGGGSEKIGGTMHFLDGKGNWLYLQGEGRSYPETVYDSYHVYEVEWSAEKIIWRLDGREYHEQSLDQSDMTAFSKPFFIILNLAVGGPGTEYTGLGKTPDTKAFPQSMYVNWVRVYKKVPAEDTAQKP
jgi:beta-glucanase (GH16 family)